MKEIRQRRQQQIEQFDRPSTSRAAVAREGALAAEGALREIIDEGVRRAGEFSGGGSITDLISGGSQQDQQQASGLTIGGVDVGNLLKRDFDRGAIGQLLQLMQEATAPGPRF